MGVSIVFCSTSGVTYEHLIGAAVIWTFLISIIIFLSTWAIIAMWRGVDALFEKHDDEKVVPCVHGHEDWDDCPDCCHQ